jgi:hypothetical protein
MKSIFFPAEGRKLKANEKHKERKKIKELF